MSHIHEKIDFTATAYIVKDGKVLLRLHDKYKRWLGIGGHIELDEGPIEALRREVKEESGLDIKILSNDYKKFPDGEDLPLPAFIDRHHTDPTHEHIDLIYVAEPLSDQITPGRDEQAIGVEFRWFSADDLKNLQENILPRSKYHALEAIHIAQNYD